MTLGKFLAFGAISVTWAVILTLALRLINGHAWDVSAASAGIIGLALFGLLIYSDRRWMREPD